jgi:predicted site-specific integrase-resolvase
MDASLALPEYISLAEAAQRVGVPVDILLQRIQSGMLPAITLHGEIAVTPTDAKHALPKEQTPEYKKHARLKGVPIGMGEAARKYQIAQPTISIWVKHGYIRVMGKSPTHKRKVLLDEADVAYCVAVYRQGGGQGKRMFAPDGTPYVPIDRRTLKKRAL